MAKYEPLTEFLTGSKRAVIELTFKEIERIIGDELPQSARQHRAFWSNSPAGHAHAKAWLDAGYETENVDVARKRVVFRRTEPVTPMTAAQRKKLGQERLAAIYGKMRGTIHIPEGIDIMEPVELEWDAMKG